MATGERIDREHEAALVLRRLGAGEEARRVLIREFGFTEAEADARLRRHREAARLPPPRVMVAARIGIPIGIAIALLVLLDVDETLDGFAYAATGILLAIGLAVGRTWTGWRYARGCADLVTLTGAIGLIIATLGKDGGSFSRALVVVAIGLGARLAFAAARWLSTPSARG